jgi:hypothetical protein
MRASITGPSLYGITDRRAKVNDACARLVSSR